MVMESINMVIDNAITKVAIDDGGEGPSSKETTIEEEAQDVEVEVIGQTRIVPLWKINLLINQVY